MPNKKPALVFEDIQPTARANQGRDYLRVHEYGLTFSALASQRYAETPTLGVKVSTNGKAIQIVSPGSFRITARSEGKGHKSKVMQVNSVAISQKAPLGIYLHQGDEVYVLEGSNA